MYKFFERKILRREFLPACFFIFSILFSSVELYPQDSVRTTVTPNGVIITTPVEERVSEEDVKRIDDLNEESLAEYAAENDSEDDGDDIAEDDDGLDFLFDDFGTEEAVVAPTTETIKVDPKDKPIAFSGSLKAELGGNPWFYPWKQTTPVASFRNTLKFVGRPATDFFVAGSLLMDFQDMQDGTEMGVDLYELYFNYTIFGSADLMAGKKDISWSLSRMLSTNIFEYKKPEGGKIDYDDFNNVRNVFQKKDRTADDSRFSAAINIPIFSYGSIQAVAQYHTFSQIDKFTTENISTAGKIEGIIGPVSLAFFAKSWAKNDTRVEAINTKDTLDNHPEDIKKPRGYENPIVGFEIVSTVLGENSSMFVQGLLHLASEEDKKFNRGRISTGVYKYWRNPVMLGIAFEYQGVWDDSNSNNKWGRWEHYFAAQIGWSRFLFDKKWTFGLEWYHDCRENIGSLLPLITIGNIIKYTDFRVGVPIYYGEKQRYGLVFEAVLRLDY